MAALKSAKTSDTGPNVKLMQCLRGIFAPVILILRIALAAESGFTQGLVSAKKKSGNVLIKLSPGGSSAVRPIRLKPSTSDYSTFVKTTALAMGRTATTASTPKPNRRLLSLLNLGV